MLRLKWVTLKDNFESTVTKSKELTQRPSNDELLKLYALYKQATEGDNTGERPSDLISKVLLGTMHGTSSRVNLVMRA